MGGVFANGLEISGKAVGAKTIAAFPDTCFTPPENPATPPGVPVPYPSFGMASDTDKGTGTVKIGGKTVNIKNKSYLTKTSGTEAGAAAKKGLVTSKNTGKSYFNSWSSDVKFDGEPVIRHTDLATHNHGSPPANTPPMVHAANIKIGDTDCAAILTKFNMPLHRHGDSKCDGKKGIWSEHMIENQFMDKPRGTTKAKFKNYNVNNAPCVCMHSRWTEGDEKPQGISNGQTTGTGHYDKSKVCRDKLKTGPNLGDFADTCGQASADNHENSKNATDDERKQIGECLTGVFFAHLLEVMNEHRAAQTPPEKPATLAEVRAMSR